MKLYAIKERTTSKIFLSEIQLEEFLGTIEVEPPEKTETVNITLPTNLEIDKIPCYEFEASALLRLEIERSKRDLNMHKESRRDANPRGQ